MMQIITVLAKAGAVLKVGKFLWNAPKIFRFFKKFKLVFLELLAEKRLPENAESVEFLKASAELIRSKIIDFPGVEEDDVAKVIEEFALELENKNAA